MLVQQTYGRHDLPRRAVAALERIPVDKRLLHRMQPAILGNPLDRGDGPAACHHRQHQAGIDPLALQQHRAGAALAEVAATLGAGEMQPITQRVEQRGAGIDHERVIRAIDRQGYLEACVRLEFAGGGCMKHHRIVLVFLQHIHDRTWIDPLRFTEAALGHAQVAATLRIKRLLSQLFRLLAPGTGHTRTSPR